MSFKNVFYLCVYVLVSVYMYVQVLREATGSVISPGAGDTQGCEQILGTEHRSIG